MEEKSLPSAFRIMWMENDSAFVYSYIRAIDGSEIWNWTFSVLYPFPSTKLHMASAHVHQIIFQQAHTHRVGSFKMCVGGIRAHARWMKLYETNSNGICVFVCYAHKLVFNCLELTSLLLTIFRCSFRAIRVCVCVFVCIIYSSFLLFWGCLYWPCVLCTHFVVCVCVLFIPYCHRFNSAGICWILVFCLTVLIWFICKQQQHHHSTHIHQIDTCKHTLSTLKHASRVTSIWLSASLFSFHWICRLKPWFLFGHMFGRSNVQYSTGTHFQIIVWIISSYYVEYPLCPIINAASSGYLFIRFVISVWPEMVIYSP